MQLRLMFIVPTLGAGGSERVLLTLARHFDREKFKLTLVVVDMADAVFQEDVPDDVELIDLSCSRVRYSFRKIFDLIRATRPDAVLSTLGHLNLAIALMRPMLPDSVKYLARESTIVSEMLRVSRWSTLKASAYRRLYNRFDRVICQSRYMYEDLVENFGMEPGKAVIIHNPVDTARVRRLAGTRRPRPTFSRDGKAEESIRLVAAGRLSHEKGFDLLIEAIALCPNPKPRLTLIGDGPLRRQLEAAAAAAGVSDNVTFTGFKQNPYTLFLQADAFVLSSRFEGFPNVVLEALACGIPVISTPAPGGTAEILDNVDGCTLATAISARALADAITAFKIGSTIAPEVMTPYEVKTIVAQYERQFA